MEKFIMADWKREQYNRIVKIFDGLNKYEIRKVIVRAADRAASGGEKAAKKGIANEFTIPTSILSKVVKKYKYGSALSMAIGVKIRDTARPLSDFKFGPKKHGARPTVEVKRGSKETLNGPSFVAGIPNTSRVAILERTNKKPYPVRALKGPSAVGMFKANESINKKVWGIIFDKFEDRVRHEINWMLNKGKN